MTRRLVSFAGSSVQIWCDGPRAVRIVDFAFGDLPPTEHVRPHVSLTVRADGADGGSALYCDDVPIFEGRSDAALAVALIERTLYHLSDRCQRGLLLHAAAVRCRNGCLLLPGQSGTGKTTLTTWLVSRGFGYLTDELVYIPDNSHNVIPLVRPLKIRTSSSRVLEANHVDVRALGATVLAGPDAILVRPDGLVGMAAPGQNRLAHIVFPQYQADAESRTKPLTKAAVGLALMSCLINARNLVDHGFPHVTRLARDVPGSQLLYGDLASAGRILDTLITR